MIGVKQRIGFDYKGRGRFQTKRLEFSGFNDRPIADYYLGLLKLLKLSGLKIEDKRTELYLTEEDKKFAEDFFNINNLKKENLIIGLFPGGGISFGKEKIRFKRWDVKKFALLIDEVYDMLQAKVVILWGPGEENLIDKILSVSKKSPIISPLTTLRQMAAIMKKCNLVVANDAGPLHLAVSQGVKTVSIFGPSDERVYGPYPPDAKNIIITKDINCRPCYLRFKIPDCKTRRCLENIAPEEVLEAINKLLR